MALAEEPEQSYTPLPFLQFNEDVPPCISVEWNLEGSSSSKGDVLRAWSVLIKSLTGEELPVFCLDGNAVRVNPTSGEHEYVTIAKGAIGRPISGVLISEQCPPEECRLFLSYDSNLQKGTITSKGFATASYLEEVGKLLLGILRQTFDACALAVLNSGATAIQGPGLLHELVSNRSQDSRIALDFLGKDGTRAKLSYDSLHQLSDALASRICKALKRQNCHREASDIIPVLLPQSPQLYIAWLGILKAGAAVCPLNLDAPTERIRFILKDVSARLVVTSEELEDKISAASNEVATVTLGNLAKKDTADVERPCPQLNTNDPAYVMYTSGSTGLPKGVVVSHRAATQALLGHDRHIPSFQRFLQFASPTFDVSVFEIFFPLFRGSTLVGCERGRMLTNLPKLINDMEIDAAEFTPTVAGELIGTRDAVPSLKLMLTIGEMLTRHVVDEFGSSKDHEGILVGMYGPTEAAIHCTIANHIASGDPVCNIGLPLDSVSALVISIDDEQATQRTPKVLPVGHIGELAVGGPQLADGYLNRDKENKAAFIDLPPYGRIYRTGDKARLQPNGRLECLGRISTGQVKLRGQRIELGEIEQVVSKAPGIRSAVVDVVEGSLIAFVSTPASTSSTHDVLAVCKQWLPRYMVPSDVVFLEELPQLASGKIDKKLLVSDYAKRRKDHAFEKPDKMSAVQQRILARCQERLGKELGYHDSLASHGLDSLQAIKLASVLRGDGIDVGVLEILEADCIANLQPSLATNNKPSQTQTQYQKDAGFQRAVNAVRQELHHLELEEAMQDCLPCTPMQIAMLVETSRDPNAYFNSIELEFREGVQAEDVREAFKAAAQASEILRTGFVSTEDPNYSYVQVVWRELGSDRFSSGQESQPDLLLPFKVNICYEDGNVKARCNIHHSIYDGWSWELVCNDIACHLSHQPLPSRLQFRSVVEHLTNTISSSTWEDAQNHWRELLRNAQPCPFPDLNSRTNTTKESKNLRRPLRLRLSEARDAARLQLISPQAIFQSALAYLLSCYAGSSGVVLGSVSSGRSLPLNGIEHVVGPCVNTLPLAVELSGMRTCRDLMASVHNMNREALRYEFLPLHTIKGLCGLSSDKKLFDTLFVWQETLNEQSGQASAMITGVETLDVLEFAMTAEFEAKGDEILAKINYDSSLIPQRGAEVFMEQLESVVSILVKRPDLPLKDLNSSLPSQTLSIANFPHTPETDAPSLTCGVARTAASDPSRVAIEFVDRIDSHTGAMTIEKITYGDLETRSNQLCNYLISLGIHKRALVAIYLDKSLELYISILAVIKAGAAYVAIPPSTPKARRSYMIKEAHCHFVLVSPKGGIDAALDKSTTVVQVDKDGLSNQPNTSPVIDVDDSAPAYAVFTSGSTGLPKGVLVTRGNIQSNLAVLSKTYPSPRGSKLLQACSQAFDVSVFEIFFAWERGMTLCATTNDYLFRDIESFINDLHITHLSMTPSVAALIDPSNVPSVQFLVCAGELLTPQVQRRWAGKGLHQGYGPSETTNIVTLKSDINSDDYAADLGLPLKNTSLFLLAENDAFSLVPLGAVGELCFGGDQIAQGYINMPELTEKQFMTHPRYGRIYRSGDFGRLLPDGSLRYLGRKDDQVKLRGQRVELGEVDAILLSHDSVKDCMTLVIPKKDGEGEQLVSFWVPSVETAAGGRKNSDATKELFRRLRSSLPAYMVPSILLPLQSFPLNTSGKKDREAVVKHLSSLSQKDLDDYSSDLAADDTAEELSDLELSIARCVAQITKVSLEDVHKHTSFFSLGLDSISAIAFSKLLKSSGHGQLDVSEILRHNTVAQLANYYHRATKLEGQETTLQEEETVIDPDIIRDVKGRLGSLSSKVEKILPCTALQEAMLVGREGNSAYQNTLVFEIFCNVGDLEAAWQAAVGRHRILRSIFVPTNNVNFVFVQAVLDSASVPWQIERVGDDAQAEIQAMRETSLPEGQTVPYMLTVVQGQSRSFLRISIHHAMYDAHAMSLLLREVETILQKKPLSPPVPFERLIRYMIHSENGHCLHFWEGYLANIQPMRLFSHRKATSERAEFQMVSKVADLTLRNALDACKHMSTTLLSVLQAAWTKMLHQITASSDLCFGTVFSGRNLPIEGIEEIVGPCFNTLPISAHVGANASNLNLIQRLRDDNAKILPYQLTSLRRLRSRLRLEGPGLFDTLVLLQSESEDLNHGIWRMVKESGGMDMPLICEVLPDTKADQIMLTFHYDRSIISQSDVEGFLSAFSRLLNHTLFYPYGQASDPASLTEGELSLLRNAKPPQESRDNSLGGIVDGEEPTIQLTPEAEDIRRLLANLAKVDPSHISPSTTIFQLGLDSINALQIATQLSALGYCVSATDVLEHPSVYGLEQALRKPQVDELNSSNQAFNFADYEDSQKPKLCQSASLPQSAIKSVMPCTPVQSGMLALFMSSEGSVYFNHMVLKYAAGVDSDTIRAAWERAMHRHDMLRTGFFHTGEKGIPFAAATYTDGTFSLPWQQSACLKPGSEELASLRSNLAKTALSKLHVPPWFVTLQVDSSGHLLQFSALHALYDAQSLGLILSDVSSFLTSQTLPEPVPVRGIQETIINEALADDMKSKDFWSSLLSDLNVTKLPDLNPLHAREAPVQKQATITSQSSLALLQEKCKEAKVSLQAACQAAWAKLLAAYTGESSVTCGVVLSGRSTLSEAGGAVFPCLVTLPVSYVVSGTNEQLLKRVMDLNVELIKHQFTPIAKIREWLKTDSPLFSTLFVFQKLGSPMPKDVHWTVVDEEASIDYPISLEIIPNDTDLQYSLTFRSDVLPATQAEIILRQLDALMVQCITSPGLEVDSVSSFPKDLLSVTPAKERHITSETYLLHGLFENTVRRTPESLALEFVSREGAGLGKKTWTYGEVDRMANRYAQLLQHLKASPGDLVATCFDKCPEAYFSILGVLKAGCAYVAIDPTAPVARKKFIMEDSGATLLMTTSDMGKDLNDLPGVEVIVVEDDKALRKFPDYPPKLERQVDPQQTCYCLYTSGTTGTPKGCEITHDNAVQAMLAFQRLFAGHWDSSSRWLQFASFHFDVSVLEQYWSWSVGICLVSCPRDILFEDLPGTLSSLEITHIDLTPSLARLVHPEEVPSLKRGVFITGGEQLRQDILDAWGQHEVIYNGYGPTEVTIGCTMYPRVPRNGKPSNVGPQFDNVSSFVFKPKTNIPVLRGGVGELCVGGPLVGKGYLNRNELTRERFVELEEYHDRVYRTGDLVRMHHDGTFCFMGRQDDQVKLRGQRLEIGEINETIMRSSEKIKGAATMVLKHAKQTKEQLVSFIAPTEPVHSNQTIEVDFGAALQDVATARDACKAALPGYMIPTHIIPLKKMPLSANNKLDFNRLKAIYNDLSLEQLQQLTKSSSGGSVPLTEELKRFTSLVAEIMGLEPSTVSPESNLLELGLDSISVISFTKALREHGFGHASAAQVMKNSTVSQLWKILGSKEDAGTKLTDVYQEAKQRLAAYTQANVRAVANELNVPMEAVERVAPCTPLQEGMIYHYLESQGKAYMASFIYELSADVSISRLRQAWKKAQENIPILRTSFVLARGGYAQAVVRDRELPISEQESPSGDECNEVAKKSYETWCAQGEHTTSPWCICFVNGPTRKLVALNIFHGLYDGNSLPLLLQEVAKLYLDDEYTPDKPSLLDALPFGPLAQVPEAKDFWRRHLANKRSHYLAQRDAEDSGVDVVTIKSLSGLEGLEAVRRQLNVTEQAVFLACWVYSLAQVFGFSPVVGVVSSGRAIDMDRVEEVIGPMFNTLPCAMSPNGSKSMQDLVRACHEYYVSMIPYQHTPLRDIMKWLRRPADEPLFDNLFVFQKSAPEDEATKSLWIPVTSTGNQDYSLALEVQRESDGTVTLTLATKDNVMDEAAAEGLCQTFTENLRNFQEDVNMPVTLHESGYASDDTTEPQEDVTKQPSTASGPFEWTPPATSLRDEISKLSEADPSTITEHTSILELGLDSIDAIRLSSRMRDAGLRLPVSAIMRGKTIAGMLEHISASEQPQKAVALSIDRLEADLSEFVRKEVPGLKNIERCLPATPLQEGMVAEMVASGFTRYFNHDVLELREWVDSERLKRAWRDVICANPILRTRFLEVSEPGIPFSYAQVVLSPGEDIAWSTEEVDNDAGVDEVVEKCISQATPRDENLTSSPLLAFHLVTSPHKRLLIISASHALYDGWSLDLMHADVRHAYNSTTAAPSRPDYAPALERIINSTGAEAADFWKSALAGYRPRLIPAQPHASGSQTLHRRETTLSIRSHELTHLCKTANVTPQALGLTCWALVVAGYLRRLDVVFGTVMLGRDEEAGAGEMMFPMFSTVAVRCILHGVRGEMLRYVQGVLEGVREVQHYPLRRAVAEARAGAGGGDEAWGRLFDTLFIYQRRPSHDDAPEAQLYESVGGGSDVEYPVCAEMEIVDDAVIWRVACRDTVMGDADVSELLDRIQTVTEELVRASSEQTITYTDGGVSVCRSQPFTERDSYSGAASSTPDELRESVDWTNSPTETSIKSVIATVAGVKEADITPSQTLFHLGLDSISAIKVASLLKRQHGILLPVSAMLTAGTVPRMAGVAVRLDEGESARDKEGARVEKNEAWEPTAGERDLLGRFNVPVEKVETVLPTSAGQTYMLASHECSRGRLYYPWFTYDIATPTNIDLDLDRLDAAWRVLVGMLPILRTVYLPTGEQERPYVQVVLKHDQTDDRYAVVRQEGGMQELQQIIRGQGKVYVPGTPAATLYAFHSDHDDRVRLALHVHHASYDAVSLPRTMRALERLYADPTPERECEREIGPGLSMRDFLSFCSHNSSRDSRRDFWRTYLGETKTERKQVQRKLGAGGKRVERYERGLLRDVGGVTGWAKANGVGVQSVFLACVGRVWRDVVLGGNNGGDGNGDSVVVGVYLSNRTHALEGLPEMLAPTVNVVPLRIDLGKGEDWDANAVLESARKVQGDLQAISSAQNSGVSLLEVREWTGWGVDVVVNLVMVPQDEGDRSRQGDEGIKLVESKERPGVGDDEGNACEYDNDHPYAEVYCPGVDVEAAVRDGRLDVGVFGGMSGEESERVLGEVKAMMSKLAV